MSTVLYWLKKVLYYGSALVVLALGIILFLVQYDGMSKRTVSIVRAEPEGAGSVILSRTRAEYQSGDAVAVAWDGVRGEVSLRTIVERIDADGTSVYAIASPTEGVPEVLVAPDSIVGEVTTRVPYLGSVVAFARTPIGFLLLVVIPALLFIADEVRKIRRDVHRIRARAKEEPLDEADDEELEPEPEPEPQSHTELKPASKERPRQTVVPEREHDPVAVIPRRPGSPPRHTHSSFRRQSPQAVKILDGVIRRG